jgi:hypothetical protein
VKERREDVKKKRGKPCEQERRVAQSVQLGGAGIGLVILVIWSSALHMFLPSHMSEGI